MNLHTALKLEPNDTVAIIGSGGKTTALWRLAEERREAGEPVLVTTSTRMRQPDEHTCDRFDSLESGDLSCAPGKVTCAGYPCGDGMCAGLPPARFADALSAGLHPLYAAGGETGRPVLYPGTDKILLIAGLRALGRPLAAGGRMCTADDLLEMIWEGVRASGAPAGRLRILLNQADTPNRFEQAAPLEQALRRAGYFALTGCLRSPFWP